MCIKTLLLSLIFAVSFNTTALAVTVTFEDIETASEGSPLYEVGDVAEGYNEIHGWTAAGRVYHFLDGNYGSKFFSGGGIGRLTFNNAPVIFEGTSYRSYAGSSTPFIELFYQGNLVHSILDPNTTTNDLVWVASGYSGLVDEIQLYGGEAYAIDNLTYSIASVPEPSGYIMFLIGLGFLGFIQRRNRLI
ncbi:MAG: PEP-CTERM sorting domain-containing protein [Methylophilaceae bacterium]|nr:PEP-CTERM sorting domain-containing protein [Methylophilaceae bacterium]